MGARGHPEGDGERVTLTDFVTGVVSVVDTVTGGADVASGYGHPSV
jgi:hypothetical protein